MVRTWTLELELCETTNHAAAQKPCANPTPSECILKAPLGMDAIVHLTPGPHSTSSFPRSPGEVVAVSACRLRICYSPRLPSTTPSVLVCAEPAPFFIAHFSGRAGYCTVSTHKRSFEVMVLSPLAPAMFPSSDLNDTTAPGTPQADKKRPSSRDAVPDRVHQAKKSRMEELAQQGAEGVVFDEAALSGPLRLTNASFAKKPETRSAEVCTYSLPYFRPFTYSSLSRIANT